MRTLVTIVMMSMLLPGVIISTASHPLNADEPSEKVLKSRGQLPIGNNVWIGAGVKIIDGVSIGDNERCCRCEECQ